MNATIVPEMNIPNMDTYWSILKNLSSDMKLELISRLSKSLLSKDQSIDDNWASQFAGEWKDSRSAESIIEDIRNSRTIAELKYGAYKSDRIKENLDLIDRFIRLINIVPFTDSIEFYAQEKNRLRSLGVSIEDFDLLIGSAACSGNLILVTDNVKHFANIKGLAIENWVKR